jgi:hypothetical protein
MDKFVELLGAYRSRIMACFIPYEGGCVDELFRWCPAVRGSLAPLF